MIRTGGGRFDPDEGFVFFVAGVNISNATGYHPWTLMAVNDAMTDSGVAELHERTERPDAKLLLDSGIFWLATRYAAANGLTMDEALKVPPEEIDDFERLLARYLELVKAYEDRLWGYVELDQGGAENKRRTRAMLEAEGLRPIPVYHPLADGYDYLDELLESYDRICIGNVVMADAPTRRALLALVWERRRRSGRRVWLHLLGYTPNQLLNALPFNSTDSSSHVYALRFGARMCMGRAMLAQFGTLWDDRFSYDLEAYGDEERGLPKKTALLSWIARSEVVAWRRQWADLERVLPDVEPWPAPLAGERDPEPAA
jgi:hypothetical protein